MTRGRPSERSDRQKTVNSIAPRLRFLRHARGRGIRDLAREVGVTPSLLSQMERGTVKPSVDTLFKLAQALNASTDAFFREGAKPEPPRTAVLQREHRARIELNQGIVWERLNPGYEDDFEFLDTTYPVGARSSQTMHVHSGRDYVVVLEGRLVVELDSEAYELGPGDSIAFDATLPHRMSNRGDVTARAISVVLDRSATMGGRRGAVTEEILGEAISEPPIRGTQS